MIRFKVRAIAPGSERRMARQNRPANLRRARKWLALMSLAAFPVSVAAQRPAERATGEDAALDSLVSRALAVNPTIRAARERVEAARARTGPAGTLPDPMLGLGIMNLPLAGDQEPGSPPADMMTMKTLALGQTLLFPGKLGLARRIAEREYAAAAARFRTVEIETALEVRKAYYELAYLDRAAEVLASNQQLLVSLIQVTESRYGVGTGGQQDPLKARVETARIAAEAVALAEARRGILAQLNALLDRPSDTAVEAPRIPQRIARAAVAEDIASIRFASRALGARVTDSPLPPLEVLQDRAVQNNPELQAHEQEIAAQTARLDLAGKAHLPDFDVSFEYGQRSGRADMLSMMISVPVPLHKRRRQDQQVAEARAELAALHSEHVAMVNGLRAEIAGQHATLERDRAQLALFVKSVIPQGRAALESATSAFQVGRAEFLTLLDNQATLYAYETAYFRALADFAQGLAELERIVGTEVLP